jgi:hypothetical protein
MLRSLADAPNPAAALCVLLPESTLPMGVASGGLDARRVGRWDHAAAGYTAGIKPAARYRRQQSAVEA